MTAPLQSTPFVNPSIGHSSMQKCPKGRIALRPYHPSARRVYQLAVLRSRASALRPFLRLHDSDADRSSFVVPRSGAVPGPSSAARPAGSQASFRRR